MNTPRALSFSRSAFWDSLDKRSLFGAGVVVLLWASAFAGIRVGLESYAPESLALLRYLVASVMLLIYAIFTRMPLPDWRDLPTIFAMGFLGFTLYNVALNAGEVGVSAGVASFIVVSAPIFMVGFATVFFGERLNKWAWIGIAISFVGVTIISVTKPDGFYFDERALLVLLAAIVQAGYSVGQKPLLKKYGALRFTTYAVWAGTVMLMIFTPTLINEMPSASTESTLAVIYMGVFPGAIGYLSWSFVLSRLPASIAGSFLYLIPAFAVIIAWFWLGEVPSVLALIGGTLIVIGVITVNTRGR